MTAGTQELNAPEFSIVSTSPSHEGFWSPLRKTLTRNFLGYLPTFASLTDRTVLTPPSDKSDKPVVTYVDRQGTGRRLTEESHESLVDALRELEAEGVCEVQIVRMENVSLRDQVRLVARSAVSFPGSLADCFVTFGYAFGVSLDCVTSGSCQVYGFQPSLYAQTQIGGSPANSSMLAESSIRWWHMPSPTK